MDGHLITGDGQLHPPSVETVEQLLAAGTHFWLDMVDPSPEDQAALLSHTFHFHPLAVEDADHFGQRPKIDTYDDFTLLVVFGVNHAGRLVEVHCFYTETFLVTVHRDHCPAMAEMVSRVKTRAGAGRPDQVMLLYRLIDTLVDGYFPVLAAMDDQIDDLEDEILVRPTDEHMGILFDLKRQLIALRKVIGPQRDMFAVIMSDADLLPGMTADAERYFRDVYDHLVRISELVDSYRDLLGGVLDTHMSTVSNRLNGVMKQLTIIATVFLPATFLTGFFGQNFGWMVNHLTSATVFFVLGVALQIVLAAFLLLLFRSRGWMSSEAVVPTATAGRSARPRVGRDHRWRLVRPHGLDVPDHNGDADSEPGATAGTAWPRSLP